MKKVLHIIMYMAVVLLAVTACDRNAHEDEYPLPDGRGGLIVGLQTEDNVTASDVYFFLFDVTEQLVHHEYFDDPYKAALHVSYLKEGAYTAVAVLNVGADFMPPSTRTESDIPAITLPEFADWLKGIAGQYPHLLTGIAGIEVEQGEVVHIDILLQSGTEGVRLPTLRLLLTMPEPRLPDYTPAKLKTRAAEAGYILRCVAELCKAGTDQVVMRKQVNPMLQADGETYLVELSANKGNYDLRLWTDYARTGTPLADTYYHTEKLKAIRVATEPYTANTDARDAAYYTQADINLAETGAEIKAELQRPLAKYHLIANDVPGYRKMMEIDAKKWPPLEQLTVTVLYENFLPSTFNILTGKPTDALTGIRYRWPLPAVGNEDEAVQIASDWVMVNGTESSVSVTIAVTDADGRVVSTTSGVPIAYRRGYLTTIRGDFLTAGATGGDFQINTDWEGEFEVRF